MNSVLDDLNGEDLNDLEARLYAQIHHEAPTKDIFATESLVSEGPSVNPNQIHRVVTNTSVINNAVDAKLSKRYWVNSENIQGQQVVQRKKWSNSNSKNDIEVDKIDDQISKLKEKTFKPFQVYEPIISNLVDRNYNQQIIPLNEMSVNQTNQEECLENKSDNYMKIDQIESTIVASSSKKTQQNLRKQRQKKRNLTSKLVPNKKLNSKPLQEKEMDEQIQNKKKYQETPGGSGKEQPLVRNFLKRQRAMKFQAKKNKAKAARQRNVQKGGKVEAISFDLISDDNQDNDDVIIIPVPPPPILTINDSSEEEETSKNEDQEGIKSEKEMFTSRTEVSFAKPKNVGKSNKTVSNITESNSSRCVSPCSVISSDDFIGQADRSRLIHERIIVNDDDLICIGENVQETYMENQQEPHFSVQDDDNFDLTIQTTASNKNIPLKTNDYRGTQDVYCESESDIPESIYSKGSTGTKTMQLHAKSKPCIIIEELSQTNSDCIEENNVTQKVKRLRKRRASSSNKEIELSNDTSDSEREDMIVSNEMNSCTTMPFITRGEAVETCKIKKRSTRVDINSSDTEFINMLQKISQGNSTSKIISLDHFSDESTLSEEDLTARKIAAEILNKCGKKCKQSNVIEENSIVDNLIQDSIRIEKSNKYSDCCIPTSDIELMEKQFDIIDKIPTYKCKSVDVILNNQSQSDPEDTEREPNTSNSNNIYNIVHTNSNNIGWNEEMFRFYNCSWGDENFNVHLLRKKMDRKARWTIYTEDRFPKYKKFSNVRCNNCLEMGHIQSKCSQPKKPLLCSMCGQPGHREPRCPNTICLRCGNKTRVFIKSCNVCSSQNRIICPICKIRGHGIDHCPDKWRRYHSTIVNNAQPNSKIIYSSKKFCCICAGRGHLSEQCKVAYRFSEYPQSLTEIKSHRKSYDDQKKITTLLPNVNSYNLLYEPDDTINFSFSTNSKITTKQYYGRFLKAVGLNHIINSIETNKRKLPISSCTEVEKPKEKLRKTTSRNNRKSQDANKNDHRQSKNLVLNPMAAIFKNNLINVVNQHSVGMSSNTSLQDSFNSVQTLTSTNESNKVEHKFKSPNILVDKLIESPEQNDFNKCEQNTTLREALCLDSDSNYSFSEHFDSNIATSTPGKTSRPMEVLPDFIPLNNNDNIDDDDIVNNENLKMSKDNNQNSDTEFENTFQLSDIPCVARIYLKKDFSDYLLSPEGNKFLIDNSKKFDVKASIDWTRVGNILVLEGLRVNQDKFHTALLLAFRTLPDKLNRKDLEKSQQVPRKRIKMIRFLSDNLRLLQKVKILSSDVNLLFKQLIDYENKNSQTSWKMAEKTRRTLNMILFGKIGFRDGKQNLDVLVNYLKSLPLISEEVITDEMREDINKSWKYIFSSQKHENYEELVETFYEMKRKNILPNIKINERIFFSDLLLESQAYNSNVTSKNIPKLILNTTEPIIRKDLSNISLNISKINNNRSTSFTEYLSFKLEWQDECIKLLTQIENITKNSSIYWSKQSIAIINNCLCFSKSNQLLTEQLQKVLLKANKGLLSYDDHRDILKICNNLKTSENS